MSTILLMVSIALFLSISFVASYIWAVTSGQFDDLQTPALRILKDDFLIKKDSERKTHE